ncbi:MAG: hypothetical protein WDW20_00555 [Neisseriaceae bacterium]
MDGKEEDVKSGAKEDSARLPRDAEESPAKELLSGSNALERGAKDRFEGPDNPEVEELNKGERAESRGSAAEVALDWRGMLERVIKTAEGAVDGRLLGRREDPVNRTEGREAVEASPFKEESGNKAEETGLASTSADL